MPNTPGKNDDKKRSRTKFFGAGNKLKKRWEVKNGKISHSKKVKC